MAHPRHVRGLFAALGISTQFSIERLRKPATDTFHQLPLLRPFEASPAEVKSYLIILCSGYHFEDDYYCSPLCYGNLLGEIFALFDNLLSRTFQASVQLVD